MFAHTVNYRKRDGKRHGRLVNLGFFVHGVPRLMLWCRLFGHKPVVDGTGEWKTSSTGRFGNPSRWVVCDRCGERGDPQGSLDPERWNIGDRYDGPFVTAMGVDGKARHAALTALKSDDAEVRERATEVLRKRPVYDGKRSYLPGPIPRRSGRGGDDRKATGGLGGQLIIGPGALDSWGFELKVGNCASEHTLAASMHLGFLGGLYLHTENHGTWFQRRLNPTGYESRVTRLRWHDGRLEWRIWSKRDSGTRHGRGPDREPWWRNGELDLRVRDRLLGPRRYNYTDVGEPVGRFVRMPEGDDFLVKLKLQRCAFGRRRGRKKLSWSVDWSAAGKGIPYRKPSNSWKGDEIYGSGVTVSDASVRAGTWPSEAVVAIAARIVADRTREGWEPLGKVTVDEEELVPA